MSAQESSVPTAATAYRLEGKALKQWWQLGGMGPDNKYSNGAILAYVVFLLTMPLLVVAFYSMIGRSPAAVKALLVAVVWWVAGLILFLKVIWRHLHIVQEVEVSGDVLMFRPPFGLKRKVGFEE